MSTPRTVTREGSPGFQAINVSHGVYTWDQCQTDSTRSLTVRPIADGLPKKTETWLILRFSIASRYARFAVTR
jgi:hypothetical protein